MLWFIFFFMFCLAPGETVVFVLSAAALLLVGMLIYTTPALQFVLAFGFLACVFGAAIGIVWTIVRRQIIFYRNVKKWKNKVDTDTNEAY